MVFSRLWVVPREPGDPPESQQIGYVNVVPARNEIGTFDSFGDTVRKFNLHLRQRPLPGNQDTFYLTLPFTPFTAKKPSRIFVINSVNKTSFLVSFGVVTC